jgi:mannose-1-phosphate guanylyltransferase/mannose-6-phosphate isomerase
MVEGSFQAMDVEGSPVYAVLLAGGVGSRLWPVSRELYPKQLVKFIGKDSLVQSTVKRLLPAMEPERIRIVCGREHLHEIARHLEEIGIAAQGKIIVEPCGRNTAPAILLAVLTLLQSCSDCVLCVFPADHVIRDSAAFLERLQAAVDLANRGQIVTFGITPHYPETGYGYIEGGDAVSHGALKTRRFVEKPDLETAQRYLAAGNFFWNSGMFAFKASVILEEFKAFQPEVLEQMKGLNLGAGALGLSEYGQLADISIDYAIMEHTRKGVVLPVDFGWSDIGSWKSLHEFLDKDADGNVVEGDVIVHNTRNCFIMGRGRLIAVNRIRDLVVVETPDSIFVSDLETSREVKSIVARLKEGGREEYQRHRTVYHPWGNVTLLERKATHAVNRLEVYPGCGCRVNAEGLHLTVVEGRGQIGAPGRLREMAAGSAFSAHTPAETILKNPGQASLVIVGVELPGEGHAAGLRVAGQ